MGFVDRVDRVDGMDRVDFCAKQGA
jgi:hypothetical protein